MLSNFKFRLYPSEPQARIMEETLETCRRLYNSVLADRIENRTGFYGQKKMLVELKHTDKHLRSVHSGFAGRRPEARQGISGLSSLA
jgi:putative transposase